MNKNMELFFVRHCESFGNIGINEEGRHPDDPRLTSLGEKQAELLAQRFSPGELKRIYSSSLLRTCQTVEPTAKKLGLTVNVMRELMEVGTVIPNASPESVKALAPSSYDGIMRVNEESVVFPTDDESPEACEKRAEYCIERIINESSEGEKTLVCTHGAFFGYLLRRCLGISLPESFNWQIDNCSVFHIKLYADRLPKLAAANDVGHLLSSVNTQTT